MLCAALCGAMGCAPASVARNERSPVPIRDLGTATPAADSPAPPPGAPPTPMTTVEPPTEIACRVQGSFSATTGGDPDSLPIYDFRPTADEAPFATVAFADGLTLSHAFMVGAPGTAFTTAHGGGVTLNGFVIEPAAFAKHPMTIAAGLDVDGTHPLSVSAVGDKGMRLLVDVPFGATVPPAWRPCDQLASAPSAFELPPLPGYDKPIGKRVLTADQHVWVETPDIVARIDGPVTLPVFARRSAAEERVLLEFEGGRLYGWTFVPAVPLGVGGLRGRRGFGVGVSSRRRRCARDISLVAKRDGGGFAVVGTVSKGTMMLMFRAAEDPRLQHVGFSIPWLASGAFYVFASDLATCNP